MTVFVNVAVLGNIVMMVFIPAEGTLRGLSTRLTCMVLVLWLIQEIQKNRWKTVNFSDGLFLFNSSPLAWVLCHAVYRLGMITLPIFDTYRYILMELCSLSLMVGFYWFHRRRYPIYYYFGMADTVIVSSLAVTAQILDIGWFESNPFTTIQLSSTELDVGVVFLHSCVCLFGLKKIYRNWITRDEKKAQEAF